MDLVCVQETKIQDLSNACARSFGWVYSVSMVAFGLRLTIDVKSAPRHRCRRSAAMAPRLDWGEALSRRRTENAKSARLP